MGRARREAGVQLGPAVGDHLLGEVEPGARLGPVVGHRRPGGAGVALPVIRGGAWPNPEEGLRVSERYHYFGPTLRVSDVGFRLVRQPLVP